VRNKIHSNLLCYTQKGVAHWSFIFWIFTVWNLLPEINFGVVLTKAF